MKGYYISVNWARYSTSIVVNYLDTSTVKISKKLNKTTLPSDMIFTKAYSSTSYEQVEKLTREFNIHYRYCIGSLIYLLSTRVDFSFTIHKLAKFPSNPGKVHFGGLVNLLRYIRDNKTLDLNYYADMKDARLSDLMIQASINTENQLMAFSYSSWKYFPYTVRSTGAYIIFYQGGPIDHGTYVPGPFYQSGAESEYNAACTAVMDLARLRLLIHDFLNKDPYIVPEEAPLIIFYSKSRVCMAKNGKDTKHTRNIARSVHFVRNGEKFKMHRIDWCEGGLKLADI